MHHAYERFLSSINVDEKEAVPIREIYHLVRNIPYGSTGNRDSLIVIAENIGSCSGKHILLRNILRDLGVEAEIITMYTHFNKSVPEVDTFPELLKEISHNSDVPDFHHYVRAKILGQWVKLDATWHDRLKVFGFAVNDAWGDMTQDTVLAAEPLKEYSNEEDIVLFKKDLISSLSKHEQELRRTYFSLLSDWIATL